MYLLDFIKANENWEELLSNPPYNLKISRDDGYILFKYDMVNSDFSYPEVLEARGIIFDEATWECVCHPFNKFGNYGESYCPDIDWSTASVQEKIDGSIIKLWKHRGYWHISTNNTIDAAKAEINSFYYSNFAKLFQAGITNRMHWTDFIDTLDSNYTYMFEVVSPENRVVIPYKHCDVYFLGLRNKETDEEISPKKSPLYVYLLTPKRYPFHSLESVIAAANKLPWTEEGYVVCDANFNRVKIKSPQYVVAHYMRNNNVINEERLIQIILDGEQEEFSIYASDYIDALKEVEQLMHDYAALAVEKTKILFGVQYDFTRGEYAEKVMKQPIQMRDFMFHCFDEKIFFDYAKKWSAKRWIKAIEEMREISNTKRPSDD